MMEMIRLTDNKLSILFFVKALNIPLLNEHITEYFIKKYLISYFVLQQLLAELVESNHLNYVKGRQNHYYTISEKGKEVLNFFQSRIDYNIRQDILNYARENRDRLRNESQSTANYKRLDNNEYEVILQVMEDDIIIMDLKLTVANADQAQTICFNWKTKAPEVYKKIMESLI